jgi:hypothetical protein
MWNEVEEALNQSAASVLTGVARLLPGMIALVVAVLVGAVLGWIVGAVVARVLRGIEFDRWMSAWGWPDFAGWTGVASPTQLVSRLARWGFVFVGFLVGLLAFDPQLTSQLALQLFGSALNLIVAFIIVVIGNVLARFLSRGVLISLVNMNVQQARLVSLGVKWLVLILTAAMALDHLNVGGRIVELAFGILFGGIVLALALTVALRSKDLADWSMTRPPQQAADDERQPVRHL